MIQLCDFSEGSIIVIIDVEILAAYDYLLLVLSFDLHPAGNYAFV